MSKSSESNEVSFFSVRIRFPRLPCISLIRVLKQENIIILIVQNFLKIIAGLIFGKPYLFHSLVHFFENKPMGFRGVCRIFSGGGGGVWKIVLICTWKTTGNLSKIYGKTLSLTAESAHKIPTAHFCSVKLNSFCKRLKKCCSPGFRRRGGGVPPPPAYDLGFAILKIPQFHFFLLLWKSCNFVRGELCCFQILRFPFPFHCNACDSQIFHRKNPIVLFFSYVSTTKFETGTGKLMKTKKIDPAIYRYCNACV